MFAAAILIPFLVCGPQPLVIISGIYMQSAVGWRRGELQGLSVSRVMGPNSQVITFGFYGKMQPNRTLCEQSCDLISRFFEMTSLHQISMRGSVDLPF